MRPSINHLSSNAPFSSCKKPKKPKKPKKTVSWNHHDVLQVTDSKPSKIENTCHSSNVPHHIQILKRDAFQTSHDSMFGSAQISSVDKPFYPRAKYDQIAISGHDKIPLSKKASLSKEQVQLIMKCTEKNQNYIYYGSLPLQLQGFTVCPHDVDIMCTRESAHNLTGTLKTKFDTKDSGLKEPTYSIREVPGIIELDIPSYISIIIHDKESEANLIIQINIINSDTYLEIRNHGNIACLTKNTIDYGEICDNYTLSVIYYFYKLIKNNNYFSRKYLKADFLTQFKSPIIRTVLFNGETSTYRKCALLMRATMSLYKTNKLINIATNERGLMLEHFPFPDIIVKKLEESSFELNSAIRDHT